LALAGSGNAADLNVFDTKSNGSSSCTQNQYDAVVTPGLSTQAVAADLLSFYFNKGIAGPGQSGCGGLSIDAYNSQSDASPNSPTAGEATAGNVQLILSSSGHDVIVTVGSAISPAVQFEFKY
jgi:hypothetical protein